VYGKGSTHSSLKVKMGDHSISQVPWFNYIGSFEQNDSYVKELRSIGFKWNNE
jgi:hypothetical protein